MIAVIVAAWCAGQTPPQHFSHPSLEADVVDVPIDFLAVNSSVDTPVESLSVPPYARALHGRRIRLAGIMYPTVQESGLTQFLFVPETRQRPSGFFSSNHVPLHALIYTDVAEGHAEDYQEKPFILEGVFEVDVQSHDGKAFALYRIRDARIVTQNHRLQYTTALVMVIC